VTELSDAIAMVASAAMGLKDIIDNPDDCNLYTVRTYDLYEWCIKTFGKEPDEHSIIKIDAVESALFVSYLYLHKKVCDIDKEFNLLKGTNLYIDMDAIMYGGACDGTYECIADNIMIDQATGVIYYDA